MSCVFSLFNPFIDHVELNHDSKNLFIIFIIIFLDLIIHITIIIASNRINFDVFRNNFRNLLYTGFFVTFIYFTYHTHDIINRGSIVYSLVPF